MFQFTPPRRVPAAGIDRIASPYAALAVVISAMSPHERFETIIVTLDRERRGRTILVVTGTAEADALLGIADMIAELAIGDPDAGGVVIASVRPGGGIETGDFERWEEADEICADAGFDLVEWFVLGASIHCPRELGEVGPRW